jgi:putative membrane protein
MSNTESTDTGTGAKPYPGEQQTRLSALWTALAVAILALAAILVFILQNPRSVELSFLVFHGQLPLAIALLFAMMLGAVVVLASGAARIIQLRGVARRARRAQANAAPPAEPADAADEGPPN